MLETLEAWNKSFPFSSIIIRILKYFQFLVDDLTCTKPQELGDNDIASLGFIW